MCVAGNEHPPRCSWSRATTLSAVVRRVCGLVSAFLHVRPTTNTECDICSRYKFAMVVDDVLGA